MAVKVYGVAPYAGTQVLTLTLHELGIPFELICVDMLKLEHKKPEYIEEMHPFGQTPVFIDEDGTKLFECRAVARYLAMTHGGDSLYPIKDPKKLAAFEQAASIELTNFHPDILGLAREIVYKKFTGAEPDLQRVSELKASLEEKLLGYERILSKSKYLAGDDITLADLFHLPYGYLLGNVLNEISFNSPKTPNLGRWWDDITSRSSWKTVLAEGEKSPLQLPI